VLATQTPDHPYQSRVAFAPTEDLRRLVFATTRSTRKYANLTADPRASMHINDAHHGPVDFLEAAAATAVGVAVEPEGDDIEQMRGVYLARNPRLDEFVRAEGSALLYLQVKAYYIVERFQNVCELRLKE